MSMMPKISLTALFAAFVGLESPGVSAQDVPKFAVNEDGTGRCENMYCGCRQVGGGVRHA